jgi:hypothetical protein
LGCEGEKRRGDYYVTQLHLRPMCNQEGKEAIQSAWEYNDCAWRGEKIYHVVRDPRDVAVSAMFYWEMKNISSTIHAMTMGTKPFRYSWLDYVNEWRNVPLSCRFVFYENLVKDPRTTLDYFLSEFHLKPVNSLDEVINRQSFAEKRKEIEAEGTGCKRPYGQTIQLKHLRHGVVGDWKSHFKRDDCLKIHDAFGELMQKLGYISGEGWWWEIE